MHIPVRLGLIGQNGGAPAADAGGRERRPDPKAACWNCARRDSAFVFVDVAEEPLLSLGRGFSAPAIFKTQLSRKDRAVLMGSDSDDFNRWEAGQIAGDRDHAGAARVPRTPTAIISRRIGDVLAEASEDPAFAAQMLMPPPKANSRRCAARPIPTPSMPRAWR